MKRLPTPPVKRLPTPPVKRLPTPPVKRLPTPRVKRLPTPPVNHPPTPPVKRLPTPPVKRLPNPPVKRLPTPPVKRLPTPPVRRLPTPPASHPPTLQMSTRSRRAPAKEGAPVPKCAGMHENERLGAEQKTPLHSATGDGSGVALHQLSLLVQSERTQSSAGAHTAVVATGSTSKYNLISITWLHFIFRTYFIPIKTCLLPSSDFSEFKSCTEGIYRVLQAKFSNPSCVLH